MTALDKGGNHAAVLVMLATVVSKAVGRADAGILVDGPTGRLSQVPCMVYSSVGAAARDGVPAIVEPVAKMSHEISAIILQTVRARALQGARQLPTRLSVDTLYSSELPRHAYEHWH